MRARSLLLLLAAVAPAAAERAAAACSCISLAEVGVAYPREGDTVSAGAQVVGFIEVGAPPPTIRAEYLGDPAQTIDGPPVATRVGQLDRFAVWSWRPRAPFEAGKPIQLTFMQPAIERRVRFIATDGGVLGPPLAALTGAQAVVTTIDAVTPTRSSCGFPRPGTTTRYRFDGLDLLAPGTIVRYLASSDASGTDTIVLATGLDGWRVRNMPCGITSSCEPLLDAPVEPGTTLCLAVELESPEGVRTGGDRRFCATVPAETMDWVDDGAFGRCAPSPSPEADAGARVTELAEVGAEGCGCSGAGGAGAAWVVVCVLAVLISARRRR